MHYLMSAAGKRKLVQLVRGPATLFAFDFDGTLSRIVRDRQAARMTGAIRQSLEELATWATTAIVSGRSLEDLRPRVDGAATFLIGNHGMQGVRGGSRMLHQAHDLCRVWIKELDKFEQQFGAAGIGMEDKIYSLTLHYRQSRAPHRAKEIAVQAAAQLVPAPRLIFGKAVVNIIPPGTPHKGSAVLELMRRLGSATALYVGDDDTDEDVFALPDERIVSVRIGRKSLSAARYYLREQSEMASLLTYLLRTYKQQSEREKNEGFLPLQG